MEKIISQYQKEMILKNKKIIVLEGIDGSRKTSQISKLKCTLKEKVSSDIEQLVSNVI